MKRCEKCGQEYENSARFCSRDGGNLIDVSNNLAETVVAPHEKPSGPQDPMIGRVLAGRYRLLSKLGQGGMGAVYKGEHVKMNRLTAIKILTSELANNPEFVTRFEREAEMASHIDNPHAVAIYDFGEAEEGLVYLAMEFLDGEPLSNVMRREGALPVQRVAQITRQAADALDAAHRIGIVHRDFKPDNLMICRKSGHKEWVEVVDFGIAKRSEVDSKHQALTQTGFVLGTPQYMSPEQVAGEQLDLRSDLYSLALVVYEMLSGALPFEGDTTQSQMVKRLLEPPQPFSRVSSHLAIPAAVEAVVMKALSRHPRDRFSTTLEFARELETAALSQKATYKHPVQPQPYTAPQPPRPTQPPAERQYQGPPPQGSGPYMSPPQQQGPSYPSGGQPQYHPPSMPTPMPGQQPYSGYYQPPPQKSKAGLVVLIIVIVFLLMMGSCFMLALIGSVNQ